VYVSPFTAWEIGTLVAKQRVHLTLSPEHWFDTLMAQPGVRLAPLTPSILLASTALPGTPPSDPADRIIVATARTLDLVVITRDRQILDYADQGLLRAIAC
jgi:PIN domain nuclease of toxin-antitoxin system